METRWRVNILSSTAYVGECVTAHFPERKLILPRDATTRGHDFIISPHPRCKNLLIATGGSFHGWKFFPIIGEYVVKMLQGKLEPEYADIWAWDRDHKMSNQVANPTYDIEGDIGHWIKADK